MSGEVLELLLVRHGESEGNVLGLMQGSLDYPLSPRGQSQARRLAAWLALNDVNWQRSYTSPLLRARHTAEILNQSAGADAAEPDDDLQEIAAGELEGLNREGMAERYPSFLRRPITTLGDFAEFGGESYDDVQRRVLRLVRRLENTHASQAGRLLLVGHGGILFQLLKALICEPVPTVAIVRYGNCTASLVRMRERRGTYIGELAWHVPLELMGGVEDEAAQSLFR